MKLCEFSLFTFQMASQFPKRDNHTAEQVWFFCVLFPIFRYHNESPTHFDSIIENALPWVMGHMGHGSSIQWVTWVIMGHLKWPIAYPGLNTVSQCTNGKKCCNFFTYLYEFVIEVFKWIWNRVSDNILCYSVQRNLSIHSHGVIGVRTCLTSWQCGLTSIMLPWFW